MVGLGMIFDDTYRPLFEQLHAEDLYHRAFGVVAVSLSAVASRTGGRAERYRQSLRGKVADFASYAGSDSVGQMLAANDVDAVCIATPDDRHFEAARYWSETRHSYAPDVLVMSRASLLSLAPADRELLVRTARDSVPVMRARWDESEGKARAEVLASGVQANDADLDAFRQAAEPLLAEYRQKPDIGELYRRIRELA